jgi:hypothetical protein
MFNSQAALRHFVKFKVEMRISTWDPAGLRNFILGCPNAVPTRHQSRWCTHGCALLFARRSRLILERALVS